MVDRGSQISVNVPLPILCSEKRILYRTKKQNQSSLTPLIFPFSVKRQDIVEQYRRRRIGGKRLLEVPSFMLIYRALQRGLKESGIERVMHPESNKYAYKDI